MKQGREPFTEQEIEEIKRSLHAKLEADEISYRQSAQGGNLAYVEGWRIIAIANEIFGFNGWSSEILEHTVDFVDEISPSNNLNSNGSIGGGARINVGVTCRVRITLKDGTFHDDIGYGMAENQRSKATAFEKAKKEAVTDAMKRALRQFGDRLGNCTYDKVFLKDVKNPPLPHPVPQPLAAQSTTNHAPLLNNIVGNVPVNHVNAHSHINAVHQHLHQQLPKPVIRPPPAYNRPLSTSDFGGPFAYGSEARIDSDLCNIKMEQ